MALKSVYCIAQVDTGNLNIFDKGFCYSNTEPNPNKSNSLVWTVSDPLDGNNRFYATITGLTQATLYYITAFAENSIDIDYSDIPYQITTAGVSVYPTITVYITKDGALKTITEVGTSTDLVVSGETTINDEMQSNFDVGNLDQIVSPPLPNQTILNWGPGYVSTYSTANPPPKTVNFSPISQNSGSWIMRQNAYYKINGNPNYTISATTTIDGVFPILWILKSSYQSNPLYYNPNMSSGSYAYFYYECSTPTPNPTKPINGKLVEKKGDKDILMFPTPTNSYVHLAYPASYGNITFNPGGAGWVPFPTVYNVIVGTGPHGDDFGIVNHWEYQPNVDGYPYKILPYQFTSFTGNPIIFSIKFI